MAGIMTTSGISTGHQGFPSRPCISGSSRVTIGGASIHRVNDPWGIHCNDDSCHAGCTSSGSSRVSVEGASVSRSGDKISCGDTCVSFNTRVTAG